MKKAFILVGHSNWGKSRTLKCLTGNSRYVKKIPIAGITFFIRRMSNDDDGQSLLDFVSKIDQPNIIMTLCPNFQENEKTIDILSTLTSNNYYLFFFVLKYKYDQSQKISQEEIEELKNYSDSNFIEIFNDKNSPDYLRANEFRRFIEKHLP
jgi:GTP-binding protein EngB required for normal cell division